MAPYLRQFIYTNLVSILQTGTRRISKIITLGDSKTLNSYSDLMDPMVARIQWHYQKIMLSAVHNSVAEDAARNLRTWSAGVWTGIGYVSGSVAFKDQYEITQP